MNLFGTNDSRPSPMPRYSLYLPSEQQPLFYRFFARFLAGVYHLIVTIRNFLYDRKIFRTHKLPGLCFSVGNLTLGGTGKSPFVMELASRLLDHAYSPVILTRGYKSSLRRNEFLLLLGGKPSKANFTRTLSKYPDEAMMYSQRLPQVPVLVARNRLSAAAWLQEQKIFPASHWILDDGFQHRKIHRDLDIVLMDAQSPVGNSYLFPHGSLREPLVSLKRADFVCFTRASASLPSASTLREIGAFTKAPLLKFSFEMDIHSVDNTREFREDCFPVLLLCGIAHPEQFEKQIQDRGIPIGNRYVVGDHEPFDPGSLNKALHQNCRSILTTEKDYWRAPQVFAGIKLPIFVARIRIFPAQTNASSFFEKICQIHKKA